MDCQRRLFIAQLLALAACTRTEGPSSPPKGGPSRSSRAVRDRPIAYRVRLDLDEKASSFSATTEIELALAERGGPVVLDAKDLDVANVELGPTKLDYETRGETLSFELPARARRDPTARVRVAYAGKASEGLRIAPDYAFTGFDTRAWMPCAFDPSIRSTFEVSIAAPAGWTGTGNGTRQHEAGSPRLQWRLDDPYPAYTLGFAVGDFWSASTATASGAPIVELLASQRTPRELAECLSEVTKMVRFFEERTGIRYPFERFSLVFAGDTAMQEKASFAALNEPYAQQWLENPHEDWLFCHELSHAWWGNLVTCHGWAHFWLNEAFATAMTAIYKEHRWGNADYERELTLARERVTKLLGANKGRPLEMPGEATFTEVGGPWPYAYGCEVLLELRARIGDGAFFGAVRAYLGSHQLGSVTTEDFLDAFAGRDVGLRDFLVSQVRQTPHRR
ncbi:MAG: hypothetical protein HOW73_45240 [Polyangiaceae bacterium]|nr:hypothetical protein [Polyangiaceae bacterium]